MAQGAMLVGASSVGAMLVEVALQNGYHLLSIVYELAAIVMDRVM